MDKKEFRKISKIVNNKEPKHFSITNNYENLKSIKNYHVANQTIHE
jgi:Txe/YoeB family toxin of Txe-Axe toxin-antitoxin module